VKKNDQFFALKVIDKDIIEEDPTMEEYIMSEIEFMQKVKGTNLIKMIEFFEDEYAYYLLLELADKNLKQHVAKYSKGLPEDEVKETFS
jgi:serine/threonine protein kinase